MGYWLDKLEKAKAEIKRKETPATVEGISDMRFSELEKRNLAVEIYSEILGYSVWLCGNGKMVNQLQEDAPDALVFTVPEFRHLLELNPGPEALKQIFTVKKAFPGSAIVEVTPYEIPDSLKVNSDAEVSTD